MIKTAISGGTAHALSADMKTALGADKSALSKWESLTPLARNEWICWVTSVKKDETRKDHLKRLISELKEGKRRPCCWIGCIHRADKAISPSVKAVLKKRLRK
jgi:uncharacterized protein YdeI (YjbR/CyaY-like superfamily)